MKSNVRWWERLLIMMVAITPVILVTRREPRFSWKTGISVGVAAVAAGAFTAWLDARRRRKPAKDAPPRSS